MIEMVIILFLLMIEIVIILFLLTIEIVINQSARSN